jgi:hypothetical protein
LDFPVGAGAQLGARERQTDSAELVMIRAVDETTAAGFGKPVTLQDQQTSGVKPLGDLAVQRRRAGNKESDTPAE